MTLGYAHPDHWLAELTSAQVAEWIAYATLENVGPPVPPDKEAQAEAKRKATRAKVEGGLRALKEKQNQR